MAGCTETGGSPLRTTTTLRHLLRQPDMVVAPGAYDCLTATRIEGEGFPAAYMTGGGTAVTRVGTPDLGFTTLTEMLASASAITSTISVPLIADADTGYSGPFNAYRTVQEYEKAGVAVLHIEDQAFPKRCGHFDGKAVIPVADMVAKIHAACDARRDDDFVLIVRTDALAVTGLDVADLAELYRRRWQVETLLAHLKTTMQMDVLHGKTVPGVLKELTVFAMVYNLVRLVMWHSATLQHIGVERISFVDALRWLGAPSTGVPLGTLIANPVRPHRAEPRVKKRRPKRFPFMINPRQELRRQLVQQPLGG
jgi:hypothetical protein